MTKTLLTAFLILTTIICNGQTSKTRFFKDSFLSKKVSERRANYSETVTKYDDGTITTEIKYLRDNELIARNTLRNGEPFGTWIITPLGREKDTLNYEFEIVYTEEICVDTIAEFNLTDYFEDNEQVGYTAPMPENGEPSVNYWLADKLYLFNNLHYPKEAIRQHGISGTVTLRVTINKQAEIENLAIYESAGVLLDKEVMRAFRKLKISEPPKRNGEPIDICILYSIAFKLN
jgi:TonB family protein